SDDHWHNHTHRHAAPDRRDRWAQVHTHAHPHDFREWVNHPGEKDWQEGGPDHLPHDHGTSSPAGELRVVLDNGALGGRAGAEAEKLKSEAMKTTIPALAKSYRDLAAKTDPGPRIEKLAQDATYYDAQADALMGESLTLSKQYREMARLRRLSGARRF
ncbi:MAG: hypothetical protein ACREOL_09945, partial [Candidatus Dormibacteria bacterium]